MSKGTFGNRVTHDYTGLNEEEKKQLRIKYNTEEYLGYRDASDWLRCNMEYVRFTVNKLLNYHKYSRYKNFRYDFHNEGALVVLDRFPKYKPGLRSINSWLYTQIQWYVAKLIRRKYLRHYKRTVGGDMGADITMSLSPEEILILREDTKARLDKFSVVIDNSGTIINKENEE